MYTRKSKGPKTVPCGTPDATGFVDDEFLSSTTVWVRSVPPLTVPNFKKT
jgi:hypothetical protein